LGRLLDYKYSVDGERFSLLDLALDSPFPPFFFFSLFFLRYREEGCGWHIFYLPSDGVSS